MKVLAVGATGANAGLVVAALVSAESRSAVWSTTRQRPRRPCAMVPARRWWRTCTTSKR